LKKILSTITACLLILFCFSACKKNNLTTIRLNEVTHSIFYATLYLAINLGYMEEEGLEIDLTNGGGSDVSMSALLSDSADIALLGPETLVYVVKEGSTNHPMVFGQLTKRDGSFLIGRANEANFNWLNLENSYILGGREGGMPAMTLEYVLNNKGLYDGVNMTFDTSIKFDLITATFEGGTGDYCTMFEPGASSYVAEGKGYYMASIGEECGEVPFTCFMANANYMKENPEIIKSFLNAVTKAYNYMLTHTAKEIAEALLPSFEGTSIELIESSISKYIEIDAWSSTPAMTQSAFNRLIAIIENAGIDVSGVKFNDVVDNSYALSLANAE
jgi:NitT/TauT family transport system substrate-binding protein